MKLKKIILSTIFCFSLYASFITAAYADTDLGQQNITEYTAFQNSPNCVFASGKMCYTGGAATHGTAWNQPVIPFGSLVVIDHGNTWISLPDGSSFNSFIIEDTETDWSRPVSYYFIDVWIGSYANHNWAVNWGKPLHNVTVIG
jgi:hypothetical protein